MSFETVNPSTEEVIASYELMDAGTVMGFVEKSSVAQKKWALVPVKDRAGYFVSWLLC